ncbi:MAG: FtsW/RodA/SpoVE family cell cycle protein, partial [Acutalibacteraceae bacterium]|nr:FtsW/RodA/SpoVE family cell cycle protein [Acutalibacteraceae bacterium]
FQSALNIFGSVDMLPLTGVTLIFVSVGGTSLISAWMILAFFKAAELHKQSSVQWREDYE